jgi:hypothetical protein
MLAVILAFSLSMALVGCGGRNESNDNKKEAVKHEVKEVAKEAKKTDMKKAMEEKPEIPPDAEEIIYAGGGEWGPAIFKHEQHASEYYEGDCYVCHDHYEENLSCRDCHTAGQDVEDLCDEDANHGCIMRQCQECHVNYGSPAPDGSSCGHCHELPPYAKSIIPPGSWRTASLPQQLVSKSVP